MSENIILALWRVTRAGREKESDTRFVFSSFFKRHAHNEVFQGFLFQLQPYRNVDSPEELLYHAGSRFSISAGTLGATSTSIPVQ